MPQLVDFDASGAFDLTPFPAPSAISAVSDSGSGDLVI